jgi:hypothetical protein
MLDDLPKDIREALVALIEKDFQLAREVYRRYIERHPELLKARKSKNKTAELRE